MWAALLTKTWYEILLPDLLQEMNLDVDGRVVGIRRSWRDPVRESTDSLENIS